MQEAAQYLSGHEFPTAVLSSLFMGASLCDKKSVAVVNLTPYDASLERVCLKWKTKNQEVLKTLSLSMKPPISQWCEQSIAMQLMEVIVC